MVGGQCKRELDQSPKLGLHDNQGLNFWKIARGVIGMLLVQIGDYVRNAKPQVTALGDQ